MQQRTVGTSHPTAEPSRMKFSRDVCPVVQSCGDEMSAITATARARALHVQATVLLGTDT